MSACPCPYVPVIRPTREHSHWAGICSVKWDQPTLVSFDAVIIATNHQAVNCHIRNWPTGRPASWTRETPWRR